MTKTDLINRALSRRAFVGGGAAALGAALLAGCGKKESATSATTGDGDKKTGGTISYDIENPTGVEPYTLEDENAGAVVFQLYDSLTFYDFETQKLEPLVAESWEKNDDASVWTFKVRKGTKFHDGTEVTAKSFKLGWERLCNPKTADTPSAVSYHLAMVKGYDDMVAGTAEELSGVTCPDDYTLKVELSEPYADFDYVCSASTLGPMPESAKTTDYQTFRLSPVGNGPFKIKGTWQDGQYVDLERFDDYYGDKALVDGVHFAIYKDSQTAYKELEAGNLDCSLVTALQMKQSRDQYGDADNGGYTAQPGKQVFTGTMLYTQYLVFNVTDPVLKDVRVRQALSYAVNRQSICDTIYEGSGTPAGDIVPEAIEGSTQGTWECAAYDPDKAGQLLDEAGYPAGADGKRNLSLKFMTNAANLQDEYQMMQSDWTKLGIDVEIDKVEYAAMLDAYISGNFQVGARAWYADYPIMDNYLYPLFSSKSTDNMSHFADDKFDEMIKAARAETDHDKQVQAMQEVDQYVASQVPVAPLNYKALSRCASARVNDLTITPQILPQLEKAWLSE